LLAFRQRFQDTLLAPGDAAELNMNFVTLLVNMHLHDLLRGGAGPMGSRHP